MTRYRLHLEFQVGDDDAALIVLDAVTSAVIGDTGGMVRLNPTTTRVILNGAGLGVASVRGRLEGREMIDREALRVRQA